jgi:serine/threonine-protein kinase
MTNEIELWRAADAVLATLLELPGPERAQRLAAMDLPGPVRAAVQRLLHMHDQRGVLDRAVALMPAPADNVLVGRTLGRWRLLEEIGRGGMSVVFRAQALDASGQVAAVKLLTLSALAGGGAERFRLEQAVLARLRHPHIATLLEAGVADDGSPWLAMALVDGVRIDRWCAQHALAMPKVIALFLQVCDAVAYAHRNLVVHRDLKPSNVLVDDAGHVRLLDFGIARLIDSATETTASQWRALTPEYAAPEQFIGTPPSTAMDVYGLGALLYRLLTGKPPRQPTDAPGASPMPPSTAARGTPAAAALRGDLDAVLLKALSPEPTQRYDSAASFALDLHACLDRRPVSARAPSVGYRMARFATRHRVGVAAGLAIALTMIAGTTVALWQAQRARAEAISAQRAQQRATQQLERAEALRRFLTDLFAATDPENPAKLLSTIDQLLDVGMRMAQDANRIDGLARADLLTTLGNIYHNRENQPRARAALDAAIAAARAAGNGNAEELAKALIARGMLPDDDATGMLDERYYVEAMELLEEQAPDSTLLVTAALRWSWVMSANNRAAAAVTLLEPILNGTWDGPTPTPEQRVALLERLAASYALVGRLHDAKRLFDELLTSYRALGKANTRTFAIASINSVRTDRKLGHFADAEAKVREALAIYAALGTQPSQYRASAQLVHGQLLQAQGRAREARAVYDASSLEWAQTQGLTLDEFPYTHLLRGGLAAAMLQHEETVRALERFLTRAQASGVKTSLNQADVGAMLANAHCALGEVEKGERHLSDGRAMLNALGAYDIAPVRRALSFAALRCALSRNSSPPDIAASEAALAKLDADLAPGEADEFLRHALLRIEALRAASRLDDAQRVRDEAEARLMAVGIGAHPLRARLIAP